MPVPSQNNVDSAFLLKLQSIIAHNTDTDTIKIEHFDGYSECRLCDDDTGSRTYHCTVNGVTWSFPDGLIHYYREHKVQPSKEFYMFIMGL